MSTRIYAKLLAFELIWWWHFEFEALDRMVEDLADLNKELALEMKNCWKLLRRNVFDEEMKWIMYQDFF